MIRELGNKPMTAEALAKACGVSTKAVERALVRLKAEHCVKQDSKGLCTVLDMAFARQLTEKQIELLQRLRKDTSDPLFDFSHKTITSLKRGGFLSRDREITLLATRCLAIIDAHQSPRKAA
jgi:hypothetical protein